MRAALPLLAVALAGCDAATEIAGDTIQTGMRTEIVNQCQGIAEGAGIAAGRVSAVCQCTADKFVAEGTPRIADITRARIQGIVDGCVAETDPDGVGR